MNCHAAHEIAADILETGTVIVGAGAAGLTLADALPGDLIVVEGGGPRVDARIQTTNWSHVSGEKMNPDAVRVHAIGGATTRWTGRCIELDDYDFEDRPWVAQSGWPIGKGELAPFYDRAWSSLGFTLQDGMKLPGLPMAPAEPCERPPLRECCWWFSGRKANRQQNFANRYRQIFAKPSRRLIYAASATGFVVEGSRVVGVRIVDRAGRAKLIRARNVVIAAGCIDNIKLLLLQHRATPGFLAPVEDWLGRGFMQHLRVRGGPMIQEPAEFQALQRQFNIFFGPGRGRHERGLALDPAYARAERLGNASIFFEYASGRSRFAPSRAVNAVPRMLGRQVVLPQGRAMLFADVEQEVCRKSRVTLHDSLGPGGIPRADVEWKITANDYRTAEAAIARTGTLLGSLGLGQLSMPEGISASRIDPAFITDSNHPLGGTRMSEDPSDGVVDRNCRVHGTDNLFVVGGSVFSTGGHANPTLTIVALAHRLAEHLIERAPAPLVAEVASPADKPVFKRR